MPTAGLGKNVIRALTFARANIDEKIRWWDFSEKY